MSDPPPDPARWRGLAVCLIAGAMTLLDISIVNVALPSLRTSLGADDSDLQWIVAGYALAFGVLLVPAGRLGDARSRRTVFVVGVALFTASSAAAGAAPDPTLLAVARVLQGLAGGLVGPQVSGFIQNLFRGPERAKAFGLFGATVSVSTAIGPLLGGLLVDLGGPDLGWRLVFYVNVPIGMVLIPLALRLLPRNEPAGKRQSLDPVGVALFAIAMVFVLLPLVEGTPSGGSGGAPPGFGAAALVDRPWWLLGIAAVLLAGFYGWERFWAARHRETVVDLALTKVRSYVYGLSLGAFFFAGFTAIFLVITLYLQVGLGYSALEAGATQTPFAAGSAVAAIVGGRLINRFDRVVVVGGLLLVIIGLLAIDLMVPRIDGLEGLKLAPAFLVAGIGGGLVISPNVTLTLAEVDPRRAGSGGGMLQTVQRVGSAIGIAVVLALFFAALAAGNGDYARALSVSLRATLGFVVAALVFAILDLVHRRRAARPASPYWRHERTGQPRPADRDHPVRRDG